ncbi:MAG: coproporphyrinogen III oxidase [Helicobacteraceae bacterium]|jgi:coproporphyrinogen III oxidase|nr:coproporphyrinogen III oxidase [Helicobacteraceae bacterium]
MKCTPAKSKTAQEANGVVGYLQHHFVEQLDELSRVFGASKHFEAISWGRDGGKHGGGVRYVSTDDTLFNRASVNVSQVHYDDDKSKRLGSATAISTIIHPLHPYAPSVHMHISWTEMRDGKGYWRVMADLNPAIEDEEALNRFNVVLKEAASDYFDEGTAQGERYFNIPALGRHRGVSHFYLEDFNSGNAEADMAFVKRFGEMMINVYCTILFEVLENVTEPTEKEMQEQLAYHTLYLFQVLTLDRGTTSGLLVHDQNDVGILGSIPRYVSKLLLASWKVLVQAPQDKLVDALLAALGEGDTVLVDESSKQRLANAVREHYKTYPEAISLQASGNIVPPTVDNHK